MKIKQIFSDMDGTLLNEAGLVSDSNAELIRQAGLPFTLVSARAPMEMQAAIEKLGLETPQIAFNGGLIFQGETVLDESPLDFGKARLILQHLRATFPELSISYYDLKKWYTDRIDSGIEYERSLTHCAAEVVDFAESLAQPSKIFKIMLITADSAETAQVKQSLLALELSDVSVQESNYNYLEVTASQAQKSRGIAYIMRHQGLTKAETAAFGDGHNDLPMLRLVGTPIAVENASAEVKAIARFISRSNVEDGVGYGIKQYLL